MLNGKERHWITGKYENTVNYDSWQQWLEFHSYTKSFSYNPLVWNIQDTDIQNNIYTMQILYMTKDGEVKITCMLISVKPSDEDTIMAWLHNHKLLNK
jgi:hypothetical protein